MREHDYRNALRSLKQAYRFKISDLEQSLAAERRAHEDERLKNEQDYVTFKNALETRRRIFDVDARDKRRAIDQEYHDDRDRLYGARVVSLQKTSDGDRGDRLMVAMTCNEEDREYLTRHVPRETLIEWSIRFKVPIRIIEQRLRKLDFSYNQDPRDVGPGEINPMIRQSNRFKDEKDRPTPKANEPW